MINLVRFNIVKSATTFANFSSDYSHWNFILNYFLMERQDKIVDQIVDSAELFKAGKITTDEVCFLLLWGWTTFDLSLSNMFIVGISV